MPFRERTTTELKQELSFYRLWCQEDRHSSCCINNNEDEERQPEPNNNTQKSCKCNNVKICNCTRYNSTWILYTQCEVEHKVFVLLKVSKLCGIILQENKWMQIVLQKNEENLVWWKWFLVFLAELLCRTWVRVTHGLGCTGCCGHSWNLSEKCNLCEFIQNSRILTGKWCQSLHSVSQLLWFIMPSVVSSAFLSGFLFFFSFFHLSKFDKIYHHVTIRELNWKIIHSAVLINAWCSNSNMSSITWAPVWWHHIT